MKKKLLAVFAAAPMLCVGWAVAFADGHEEEQAPWVTPVDTFTCSFNDGMDMDDLNSVIADWNEFLDSKDVADYGAMVMTPNYHGPDTFEFGWLGFWTSQEAMGAGIDMYRAEAGNFDAAFAKVSTCDTHEHWASINVKDPGRTAPDNFVLMFSNCTRDEDVSWDDLFGRIKKATAYMEEQGSKSGEYMMWQVFGGGGDPGWDFKWVSSYANYTDFGKDYQHNANGGGRQKMNEIMDEALDCDAGRVYNARMIRRIPEAEAE
ncbi:MAG: hypothetical protein QNJ14_14785 [Woeseiaceae bacterium]|nr:hypothetical protein [Woeseiaceae bacterium]